MEAAVGLAPLDALIPASRSAPNRATLVAAGTLPALAAILDAGISRLNTLAAILGEWVSEDQLCSLLQDVTASTLSALMPILDAGISRLSTLAATLDAHTSGLNCQTLIDCSCVYVTRL